MLLHLVIAIQFKRYNYVFGYLAQSLMLATFLMYGLIINQVERQWASFDYALLIMTLIVVAITV